MAKERKQIRDKIKTILDAANITYDAAVVPTVLNRAVPYWKTELPTISIYMLDETSDHEKTAPRRYKRKYRLVCEIVCKEDGIESTDDIIDEIAEQIENVIDLNPTLGFTTIDVEDIYLLSTNIVMRTEKAEINFTAGIMTYEVVYYDYAPEAQPLEDFESHDTGIGIDGHIDPDKPDIAAESTL